MTEPTYTTPQYQPYQPQDQQFQQQQGQPQQQFPQGQQFSSTPPPPPPTNVGWAVAAVVFFWPLAFSAFTHAMNVFPRWSLGDYAGAQDASDRAKKLGKISMWIAIIGTILVVILYTFIIIVAINSGDSSSSHSSDW